MSTGAPTTSQKAADFPLFPVATHKFIILSICTFTFYELYWCYQNWKRLKGLSGDRLSPFWRAFFGPLWGFSLFGRIKALAASQGLAADWNAGVLGTFYLVLHGMWRLPGAWWWISFATIVAIIPAQLTAQRINDLHAGSVTESRNDNYTAWNVAIIVIGGILLILAIVGTAMPDGGQGQL